MPLSIRGRAKCLAHGRQSQSLKWAGPGDNGASGRAAFDLVRRKVAGRQLSGFFISSSPWRADRFQQASQAMRPEKPEAKGAGRQLGRSLIVMALLLPVLPRNLRAVFFSHLMTISSAQGQGKGVSSCIRILSDKARHEVVIITKHEGARSSSWWERLKMEVICTARGSQEVAHLGASDFQVSP